MLSTDSVSVKKLSKEMFFSPEYLSRLFKKETGYSLVSFIQNRKIERAARLIRETDLPIESVMEKVGYSDKKHFYELFTKTYSFTPAAFRKVNK
jgi:two-component system response regulator YesN